MTGTELPDISAIIELQKSLQSYLRMALGQFVQSSLSHSLRVLLASRSILSARLGKSDFQLLSRYTEDCAVSTESLERYWSQGKTRASIETWLDRLTLDSSDLGGSTTMSWDYRPSLLDRRPIYRSQSGRYILCLTHKIATELSQLLHAHWSNEFKDRYLRREARRLRQLHLNRYPDPFREQNRWLT